MTELPESWCMTSIGDIAHVGTGATPKRGNPTYYDNGTIPWITSAAVNNSEVSIAQEFVTEAALRETNLTLYEPGTLLVAMYGEGKTRGKCSELRIQATTNQALAAIVLPPSATAWRKWLRYALEYQYEKTRKLASGGVQPNLNLGLVRRIEIPFAPERCQRRTIDAMESYFMRLADAVATLERVERNIKRYRASVFKSAVEGRLVPTEAQLARQAGRTFEPAIDLLTRFTPPLRPNRWNSRSSDVVLGHAALAIGNPRTALPEGWAWIPLVDVARMESGHTPSRAHPEWWDGDVPWLSIPDARDHDGRTILDTTQHTNAAGLTNSAARILPSGTVSICRTAFSIGYVVVLGRPMATSQDFVNWTPTGAVSSHWLRLVFGADREALRRFGKGSVNKTIYFPEWLSIHIALPPLAEQERIVKEVDRLLSLAESTEVSVGRNLRQCDKVRQAILKWAFEGKLADQDLNDEPASMLLERIKAEREAGKSVKGTGPQRTATKKQVRA